MADTSRYTTIDALVKEYLDQSLLTPLRSTTLYQLCVNGIRENNLFNIKDSRKVIKLALDSNYIATLPSDFLTMHKIGIPLDGKLWTFTKDEGIITSTSTESGAEVLDSDYGEGVDINPVYYSTFGAKGGVNKAGYYKFDYSTEYGAGRIIFRNTSRTDVLLEYSSSGVSLGSDTVVPVICKGVIKAYMAYEEAVFRQDIPISRIQLFEDKLYRETQKLRMITLPTLTDIEDAWTSESTITWNR